MDQSPSSMYPLGEDTPYASPYPGDDKYNVFLDEQGNPVESGAHSSLHASRQRGVAPVYVNILQVPLDADPMAALEAARQYLRPGQPLPQIHQCTNMTIVDPASKKLAIPFSRIRDTRALTRPGIPSLCLLFLAGKCRQGSRCHQIHADVPTVVRLRQIALAQPTCCGEHGDSNRTDFDDEAFKNHYVIVSAKDRQVTVPIRCIAVTEALLRLLASAPPRHRGESTPITQLVPVGFVCRLHASGRCRYNDDCKFLHVCRALVMEELQEAIVCRPPTSSWTKTDPLELSGSPDENSMYSDPNSSPKNRDVNSCSGKDSEPPSYRAEGSGGGSMPIRSAVVPGVVPPYVVGYYYPPTGVQQTAASTPHESRSGDATHPLSSSSSSPYCVASPPKFGSISPPQGLGSSSPPRGTLPTYAARAMERGVQTDVAPWRPTPPVTSTTAVQTDMSFSMHSLRSAVAAATPAVAAAPLSTQWTCAAPTKAVAAPPSSIYFDSARGMYMARPPGYWVGADASQPVPSGHPSSNTPDTTTQRFHPSSGSTPPHDRQLHSTLNSTTKPLLCPVTLSRSSSAFGPQFTSMAEIPTSRRASAINENLFTPHTSMLSNKHSSSNFRAGVPSSMTVTSHGGLTQSSGTPSDLAQMIPDRSGMMGSHYTLGTARTVLDVGNDGPSAQDTIFMRQSGVSRVPSSDLSRSGFRCSPLRGAPEVQGTRPREVADDEAQQALNKILDTWCVDLEANATPTPIEVSSEVEHEEPTPLNEE